MTKDVEPFGIVGGVPAKLIRYRFDREDIEFLMKYEWWNRERSWIEKMLMHLLTFLYYVILLEIASSSFDYIN